MPSLSFRRALIIAIAAAAVLVTAKAEPDGTVAADPPPGCRFDDVPAPAAGYGDWASTLVDTIYRLPAGYAPPDLVPVARAGLEGDGEVRSFVIPDLRDMVEAAARDGIALRAASAYRSEQSQAGLLAQAEGSSAAGTALELVARPGHSEHELGTTIDFGSADGAAPSSGDWPWLAQNGWRYGFVLSYPAGKSPATTCYGYEPWHFRYFGRERAAEIHASGLSTREFLWRLLEGAHARPASGHPAGTPAGGTGRQATVQAQPIPIEGIALSAAAATGCLGFLVLRRRRHPAA